MPIGHRHEVAAIVDPEMYLRAPEYSARNITEIALRVYHIAVELDYLNITDIGIPIRGAQSDSQTETDHGYVPRVRMQQQRQIGLQNKVPPLGIGSIGFERPVDLHDGDTFRRLDDVHVVGNTFSVVDYLNFFASGIIKIGDNLPRQEQDNYRTTDKKTQHGGS